MKKITAVLVASLFAGAAQADLSSLTVQFSPSATSFTKGTPVAVTAVSNGTNAQYKFDLDRIVSGQDVAVLASGWSATNTFNIDTSVVNVQPGKHRLRVYARESANKVETLVKTEFFQVAAAPLVTACDSIVDKTYDVPVASFFNAGDLTLSSALALQSTGIPITFGSGGAHYVKSIAFQDDVASVGVYGIETRVCAFICIPVSEQFLSPVDVSYTCSGNTVTLNAAGALSPTEMSPNALMDLLGGESMPVKVTGNLTIDTANDTVAADGITFD